MTNNKKGGTLVYNDQYLNIFIPLFGYTIVNKVNNEISFTTIYKMFDESNRDNLKLRLNDNDILISCIKNIKDHEKLYFVIYYNREKQLKYGIKKESNIKDLLEINNLNIISDFNSGVHPHNLYKMLLNIQNMDEKYKKYVNELCDIDISSDISAIAVNNHIMNQIELTYTRAPLPSPPSPPSRLPGAAAKVRAAKVIAAKEANKLRL